MQAFLYDTVDSTNDTAKKLIADRVISGDAYVLTREQTSGKGTRGKSWVSPKDAGLYLSVIRMLGAGSIAPTTAFTLSAAAACVETIAKAFGVDVKLKPVNDLYVDGRKLGGILTETIITGGTVAAVITGVGVNTHHAKRNIPQGEVPPICLQGLLAPDRFAQWSMNQFAADLARSILNWHALVLSGRLDFVETAWLSHALPGAVLPRA